MQWINKRGKSSRFGRIDVFKFRVFKAQFGIQREEVKRSLEFMRESWNYALRNDNGIIYEPITRFLDPLFSDISELSYYQNSTNGKST